MRLPDAISGVFALISAIASFKVDWQVEAQHHCQCHEMRLLVVTGYVWLFIRQLPSLCNQGWWNCDKRYANMASDTY